MADCGLRIRVRVSRVSRTLMTVKGQILSTTAKQHDSFKIINHLLLSSVSKPRKKQHTPFNYIITTVTRNQNYHRRALLKLLKATIEHGNHSIKHEQHQFKSRTHMIPSGFVWKVIIANENWCDRKRTHHRWCQRRLR